MSENLWNPKHRAFIGENNPMNGFGATVKELNLNESTCATDMIEWIHSLPRYKEITPLIEERIESWIKVCQMPAKKLNGVPVIQGLKYLEITPKTTTKEIVSFLLEVPRWEEGFKLSVISLNRWARERKPIYGN